MNKLEKIRVPLHENPSGDPLYLDIFTIRGPKTGQHIHFQANVHGAELQGNAVIYQLMNTFLKEDFSGSVTFIPQANSMGLNQKSGTHTNGRFHSVTGNNFNRSYLDLIKNAKKLNFDLDQFVSENASLPEYQLRTNFKTLIEESILQHTRNTELYGLPYDKKLALLLQKTAAKADFVFDLHTGPVACRYVYCGEFMRDKVKDLNFPHTLLIPNEFAGAMDEACFNPWFQLNERLKKNNLKEQNFESYTIELGSEEVIDFEQANNDAANILHLLWKRGVFSKEKTTTLLDKQYYSLLQDYHTYYSPYGGLIDYIKTPGDHLKKGDLFGKVLSFSDLGTHSEHHDLLKEITIQNDGILINHCPSSNIMEGTELFQMMENVQTF